MRLGLAVLFAFLLAQPSPAHATGGTVEVVLLMGQSNMVGGDLTAPLSAIPMDQRVWAWSGNLGGSWWWHARESLHGAGYGPGLDFGKHLLAIRPEVHSVMLIPCAVSGTTADRWVPGADLYERCLYLAQQSGLRPTGALVYQGESDATTLAGADAWAPHFSGLVDGLRDEYGDIPVVYAQIGLPPGTPYVYWDQIRNAQAVANVPRTAMVQTADLPLLTDGLHLRWVSEIAVGQRMARAYAELMDSGV